MPARSLSSADLAPTQVRSGRSAAESLWIRPDLVALFAGLDLDAFLRLGGERVRTGLEGARHTSRLERGGRRFYLKVHEGVGWGEIWKCWLQGKRAVVDARPEARALERLAELGLGAPRLAAFGVRGRNPARRRSFVLTESLEETEDLNELLRSAHEPPAKLRQAVTRQLGRIIGRMHAARIAHQDLYLAHVRVRRPPHGEPELFLIDWHRARFLGRGGERALRKDLAALRYSTLDRALTRADCARFWSSYRSARSEPATPAAERAQRLRIEAWARAIRARIARRGGAD